MVTGIIHRGHCGHCSPDPKRWPHCSSTSMPLAGSGILSETWRCREEEEIRRDARQPQESDEHTTSPQTQARTSSGPSPQTHAGIEEER